MPRLAATLFVALAIALLSGCAGKDGGAAEDAAGGNGAGPGDATGSQLAPLDASASVAAPQWQPGQWWEWETSFGTATLEGTRRSIVLAAGGSGYTLVTEDDAWAKDEAAFGVPFLGEIGKGGLAMDGWGGEAWSLLQFPLSDGKTWTASVPNIAWDIVPSDTAELAMSAAFDPAVGAAGGFRLTGRAVEQTLVEASYDPSTGWFSDIRFWDTDSGQPELEIGLRATAAGLNYTGPYFQHTATELLRFEDLVGFSDVPTEGGQPYTQPPQPYHTFTMGEGTTLYGYVVGASVLGTRGLLLVDPENGQRNLAATGTPENEQVVFFDEPGKAGEWKLATAGAGGFSGAFVALFELQLSSATM